MFQILIVEDDKELSQLFQKVLVKNGYQVKSASDGALALEILDKEHILKDGELEDNWNTWVEEKMAVVQPVLDQLNK